MRKWIAAHRRVLAVSVVVLAWGAGIAVFISLGQPVESVLFNAVLWAVFVGASWYFDARRQRKTAAKLDTQGGMLVYVRYPDSRPGSLSGIWNMGVASLDDAALKFQPSVYDTLEPSGRPTMFRNLGAGTSEPRKISRKESRYVTHLGFQAIRLSSDKGAIEVAGRPESLRKILDVATGTGEAGRDMS